jgi:hypothetical protein
MGNESGAWVDEEFEALDPGDPRRDRRAKELLRRFAAKPTASIPGAWEGWAETIGAYRFLGNEEVEWTEMMQPPFWICRALQARDIECYVVDPASIPVERHRFNSSLLWEPAGSW